VSFPVYRCLIGPLNRPRVPFVLFSWCLENCWLEFSIHQTDRMQCRLCMMIHRLHSTKSNEPLFQDWTAGWNWSLRWQMKSFDFVFHSLLSHSLTESPNRVTRTRSYWLTQSPTRLYLGELNMISLSVLLLTTGWVTEIEVLWATLEITNEATSE